MAENAAVARELEDGFDYHIFVSHSHKDSEEKELIVSILEKHGFSCCDPENFVPGKPVVDNIIDCLKVSQKIVALISKDFMESLYVGLEIGETIEREGRSKRVTLIPIVKDVELRDIPARVRRQNMLFLEDMKTDRSLFEKRLVEAVERQELSELVPAGDIAHGLAWSYYYGYLRLVLPGMRKRVQESNIRTNNKNIPFLDKMMIILPDRGYCPTDLKADDELVEHVGHIPFTASRAGNKNRDYKSSVYKVTHPDSQKQVLVIADFATPLMSMYEMEAGEIAGISKQEVLAQKLKFEEKLKDILEADDNCRQSYVFCPFDDKRDVNLKPVGWKLSTILANRALEALDLMSKVKEETERREKRELKC